MATNLRLLFLFILFPVLVFGQLVGNVGIITNPFQNPQPLANSTTGYVLTLTGTNTINWAAAGGGSSWLLTGNSGTTVGTNFLGTTDNQSLEFKVGKEAGYIDTIGRTNFGYQSLYKNTSGIHNAAFGFKSLYSQTSASSNTAIGYDAGFSNTADANVFIGDSAGYSNTAGSGNVYGGYASGVKATTAIQNAAWGNMALYNNTGNANTAIGSNSLYTNTTGTENTAIGWLSLYVNNAGSYNTAAGDGALGGNTTGNYNTAVGQGAGGNSTSNNSCVYIGDSAGYINNSDNNTYIGTEAAINNQGIDNLALGYRAGYSVSTINYSHSILLSPTFTTVIGGPVYVTASGQARDTSWASLSGNAWQVGGNTLSASPSEFGSLNTDYIEFIYNNTYYGEYGDGNVCLGHNAGSTGSSATVLIGDLAGGGSNTSNCTGIGYGALNGLNSNDNTAIGYEAGYNIHNGIHNTFLGEQAGYTHYNGSSCLYSGYNSGYSSTGDRNVCIGDSAGVGNTTGHDNTFIGYQAEPNAGTYVNSIGIGSGASVQGSNEADWGNSSILHNIFNGDMQFGRGNYGASGNVLISQGSGVSPVWSSDINDNSGVLVAISADSMQFLGQANGAGDCTSNANIYLNSNTNQITFNDQSNCYEGNHIVFSGNSTSGGAYFFEGGNGSGTWTNKTFITGSGVSTTASMSASSYIGSLQINTATTGTVTATTSYSELSLEGAASALTIIEPQSPTTGEVWDISTNQTTIALTWHNSGNFYGTPSATVTKNQGHEYKFDGTKWLTHYIIEPERDFYGEDKKWNINQNP